MAILSGTQCLFSEKTSAEPWQHYCILIYPKSQNYTYMVQLPQNGHGLWKGHAHVVPEEQHHAKTAWLSENIQMQMLTFLRTSISQQKRLANNGWHTLCCPLDFKQGTHHVHNIQCAQKHMVSNLCKILGNLEKK